MAIKQLSRDNFGIRQARFVLSGVQFPLAVGGTETVINPDPGVFYRVHSFTDVGESSLEVLVGGEFEYLVVAGGGSGDTGGNNGGGGGGAGGWRKYVANEAHNTDSLPLALAVGTESVIVGKGGTGYSVNGLDSVFAGMTAIGGGRGGGFTFDNAGGDGGCGGGGRGADVGSDGGQGLQGGDGGGANGSPNTIRRAGGGGGGATESGGVGNFNGLGVAGDGGDGFETLISVSLTAFCGGGGGAPNINSYSHDNLAVGGLGGGGDGATQPDAIAQNGSPNTGGGGGATSGNNSPFGVPGNGGSGIVIVRYRITEADFIASGGVIA